MTKNVCLLTILLLLALAAGCNQATDQNTASATPSPTTTQGPDNSEITTSVDANGTKTETRTFKNNPHISKVVVTTRDGKKTVKVYSPSGEEKVVNTTENALEATGDLARLDDAVFDGIHRDHKQLFSEDALAAWAA